MFRQEILVDALAALQREVEVLRNRSHEADSALAQALERRDRAEDRCNELREDLRRVIADRQTLVAQSATPVSRLEGRFETTEGDEDRMGALETWFIFHSQRIQELEMNEQDLQASNAELAATVAQMQSSRSWRVTAPLRNWFGQG